MTRIGEPGVDSSTANIAISMVAACVMYTVLQKIGLANGNLNCVADAVGRSGAGLKARIELLKERYEAGEFPKGGALFSNERDTTSTSPEPATTEESEE